MKMVFENYLSKLNNYFFDFKYFCSEINGN